MPDRDFAMPTPSATPARHTLRIILSAATVAAGLLLGACGGGPSRPRALDATPITINDADWAKMGYRRDWTGFPYVSARGRLTDIYAGPDIVIAQESGSAVSVLDARTGARRWSNILASRLTKFLSIRLGDYQGRRALIVSSEPDVFLLDPDTGNLLGRQSYEKVATAGPVVAGDILIYGTASGEVMGHYLRVNDKLWGFDMAGAIERAPVAIAGAVAAISRTGQVVFLDPATGSLIGLNRMFAGANTDPVAGKSFLFVASLDQSLYAFEPGNARMMWRHRTGNPLTVQPTAHNGVLYCELADEGLTAFNQDDGRILWSNKDLRGTVIGMRSGRLLVWDGRRLASASPTNGAVFETITVPETIMIALDTFVDGNVYLLGDRGSIAKLVPRN